MEAHEGYQAMIIDFGRKMMGCAAVLACTFATYQAEGQELAYDDMRDNVEYVLELIAKRPLSADEVERAANEYYASFDHHCGPRCIDAVNVNKRRVQPMATDPGSPRDLLARQYYSRVLYFSPAQAGSFIQSLSDEVDPIQLADAKSERIMTQGDVLGVLNITHFLRHGGEPTEQSFAATEIDELIASFRREFVEGYKSLPYRAGLAAELWAGLHQNWNRLTAEQKDAVRTYLSDARFTIRLDIPTYQAWLGMSYEEALAYEKDDHWAQLNLRAESLNQMTLFGSAAVAANVGEGYWRW